MSCASLRLPTNVTGNPAHCQQPPMKQPIEPAPRIAMRLPPLIWLAPPAVGLHSLIGKPQAFRRSTALPKDVDRHAAARVPIAADAEPSRLHLGHEALPDADRNILVEAAMVAELAEEQLQALALDDRLRGRIVDDEVREVRLPGDWAQRRELGRGEAHEVKRVAARVWHIVEHCLFGRSGKGAGLAEVPGFHGAAITRQRRTPATPSRSAPDRAFPGRRSPGRNDDSRRSHCAPTVAKDAPRSAPDAGSDRRTPPSSARKRPTA